MDLLFVKTIKVNSILLNLKLLCNAKFNKIEF